MLRRIFTDYTCRNVLAHVLMLLRPSQFGAVARLNRHCAKVAADLLKDKQNQWLEYVPSENPNWFNRRFKHSGLWHGPYKEWRMIDSALVLRSEAEFIDGRLCGEYRGYWLNGKLHIICRFEQGLVQGVIETLYEDGMPVTSGTVVDDFWHGTHTLYTSSGRPIVQYNFKHGRLHGLYRSWHREDVLECECNFKDGRRHGEFKYWRKDGALLWHLQYVNGRLHGEAISYCPTHGSARVATYVHGTLMSEPIECSCGGFNFERTIGVGMSSGPSIDVSANIMKGIRQVGLTLYTSEN